MSGMEQQTSGMQRSTASNIGSLLATGNASGTRTLRTPSISPMLKMGAQSTISSPAPSPPEDSFPSYTFNQPDDTPLPTPQDAPPRDTPSWDRPPPSGDLGRGTKCALMAGGSGLGAYIVARMTKARNKTAWAVGGAVIGAILGYVVTMTGGQSE